MKRSLLGYCGLQLAGVLMTNPAPLPADSYPPEAFFNLVDANHDGSISYGEWKHFITGAASASPAKTGKCFKRSRLKVFAMLDRNRDGKISWLEWSSAGARGYDPDFPNCF